jgi:hypothetical protein
VLPKYELLYSNGGQPLLDLCVATFNQNVRAAAEQMTEDCLKAFSEGGSEGLRRFLQSKI